jgi:siroheme synthase-like protein
MKYLPVGLDIRGRLCLVVGGGEIGTRKVGNLLNAGGNVTLVSPQATPELESLAEAGEIRWVKQGYQHDLLEEVFLVVAATDDQELNASVVEDAKSRKALVCDASSSDRSQVIFGALLQGEGVTVAVFTDGQDPSKARQTRDRIRTLDL